MMNDFVTRAVLIGMGVCLRTAGQMLAIDTWEPITDFYRNAAEVRAMPLRTALIDERTPCYVILITSNGKKFLVGGPGSTREFAQFLATLKDGVLYRFPDVFIEFETRAAAQRKKL